MGVYREDFKDHSIVIEIEKVEHISFDKLVRVKSAVITHGGKDIGYSYPRYEGTSEPKVAHLALSNAKIYIQNRT